MTYLTFLCSVVSAVSDSLRPYGLQPSRVLFPGVSPGKNAGMCYHILLLDLPNPGIKLLSSVSPALQADSLLLSHQESPDLFTHKKGFISVSYFQIPIQIPSRVQLFAETPWTVVHQVPLSMGLSRQEYWSGQPFLSPGDLTDPGTEPTSLTSPALVGFTTSAIWEAPSSIGDYIKNSSFLSTYHVVGS